MVFLASMGGLGGDEAVTPALRALHDEKAAIEARIAELRSVKAQLPLERYEDELEALLVELALKNREIRAAGGAGRVPGMRAALTLLLGLASGAILAVAPLPGTLATAAPRAPQSEAAPQEAPGFVALRAGRYDEAVRTLRPQALDGSAAALSGWVTALREQGDYEGAVEAAERGVERGVAGARALLGAALLDLGRVREARAALEAGAGERGVAGALARVELGILEYRYGDRDVARGLFDGFIDYYNSAPSLTAAELTAVGRALVHLSRWNYEYATTP